MKTLINKIADIEAETANIEEKIIPELQINMAVLFEEFKSAEGLEEEAKVLGKMEKVGAELEAEKRTVLVLKGRHKKLMLYHRPRRKARGPCGKC